MRPTPELMRSRLYGNPQLVFFSSRFHRSATPRQPRSWATTSATISSRGWFLPTRSRPRPWWTSFGPWAGRTCPPWPLRAATVRREWRPSRSSLKKQVWRINKKRWFGLCNFPLSPVWFNRAPAFLTRGRQVLHLRYVVETSFRWLNYWSAWQHGAPQRV